KDDEPIATVHQAGAFMTETAHDAGAGARIHRAFIDVHGTPMHVRWAGCGVPVLLVQQSPTSARVLENRLHAFADRFLAIAPDIPGMGQSGTIAEPVPTIGLLA